MPNPTTSMTNNNESDTLGQQDCSTEHTCACGEKHQHRPGTPSHRESCTSTLKFGDSCCCGSGETVENARHRCGHGPRCH